MPHAQVLNRRSQKSKREAPTGSTIVQAPRPGRSWGHFPPLCPSPRSPVMPTKRSVRSGQAVENLSKRAHALFDRVTARAQKEADVELESARRVSTISPMARELLAVEAEVRELSPYPDELSDCGRHRLREMRAYRSVLRDRVAVGEAFFNRRAAEISEQIEKSRRVARKGFRSHEPREIVRGLLDALEPLAEWLTVAEKGTAAALRAALETTTESVAADEAEPETPSTRPEAPPPAAWNFDEPDTEMLRPPAPGGERDLRAYRLDRWAQELSLVRGFDVLLTPQFAHGLAQYPHQIETARTVLRRMRGRALLCDEVGLGKTIEAGMIAREYVARGLVRRILILAPPALVGQWRQEMREKFDLEFVTHDDPEFRRAGPAAWGQFDRILASLSTARLPAHRAEVVAQEYDLIIVDEAHHLRSRTSQGWKFVNDLKKRYILLLTATPVQNNLDELFNLITLLSPGQLKSSSAFKREFVTRGDPRNPRNRERLRALLSEVMVRNTRSQVNIAMPPRLAATHRVTPTRAEAELYAAVTKFVREGVAGQFLDRMAASTLFREAGSSAPALAATLDAMSERRPAHRSRLQELAADARDVGQSAKVEQLCALLARRPDKSVVFTFFRETARLLTRELERAGISHTTLTGEQSAAEKERALADFSRDRKVLVSTDVGSEGRNLQFCRAIVNFDLPWNPMRIEQRVGRVHRIGQREEVLIDTYCARHTIEDHILRILDSKLNMFELVVGEIGAILGNLESEQGFEEIALEIWSRAASEEDAAHGFDELGAQLQDAHTGLRQARELDEALFGDELAAPLLQLAS